MRGDVRAFACHVAGPLPVLAAALASATVIGVLIVRGDAKLAVVGIATAPTALALLRRPRLGLLLGVALLLVLPYWYRLGVQPASAYRVAALLALAVLIDATRTRWCRVDTAFVAMLGYVVIRWWFSRPLPDQQIFFNEWTPATFYFAARLWWRGDARVLLWVVLVGGAVGALTVVRESLHGSVIYSDPTSYAWKAESGGLFRPGGIFGSPPGAATVLSVAALAGLPLVRMYGGRMRSLAVAALLACLVGLVLTYTRAGLIAFGAGVVLYLFLSNSPLISSGRAVIAVLALFLGVMLALPTLQHSRTFQEGVLRRGTLASREGYWKLALPIVTRDARTAVFGAGVNATLVGRFGGVVPGALAAAPVLTIHGTHNQYVLTLLEQGVVGLSVFVAWLLMSVWSGMRLRGDPVAGGLTASVLAFAMVATVDNVLLEPPSFALAALMTGLLAAMSAARGVGGRGRRGVRRGDARSP